MLTQGLKHGLTPFLLYKVSATNVPEAARANQECKSMMIQGK